MPSPSRRLKRSRNDDAYGIYDRWMSADMTGAPSSVLDVRRAYLEVFERTRSGRRSRQDFFLKKFIANGRKDATTRYIALRVERDSFEPDLDTAPDQSWLPAA